MVVVSYKFYTGERGFDAITADRKFHDTCLASIRDWNPMMIDIEEQHRQISCLEYILDALNYVDSHNTIDVGLFENLSRPDIDLTQTLCHDPLDDGTPATCIPKIVNGFVAASNAKSGIEKGVWNDKMSIAMQEIIARYPDLFQGQTCNVYTSRVYSDSRDYTTCFEKLLEDSAIKRFIDINRTPDGFFDAPMCRVNDTVGSMTKCYSAIVNLALSSASPSGKPYVTSNATELLINMIASKKFEKELYTISGGCFEGNLSMEYSCVEKILNSISSTPRGVYIVKSLIDTYTGDDGIIDIKSETSPFSGKKCHISASSANHQNCLDNAVKFLSDKINSSNTNAGIAATLMIEYIASQPMFADGCGTLKFLSLITPLEEMLKSGLNTKQKDYSKSISNKIMKRFTLEPLKHLTCTSEVYPEPGGDRGRTHRVNGVDYALELGIPILHQMYYNGESVSMLLTELEKTPCVSIHTGEPIPCIQKLTNELFIDYTDQDPELNRGSVSIIKSILEDEQLDVFNLIYPKGKPYFTDYLSDAIYNAISVNNKTSSEAIALLGYMIGKMGDHVKFGVDPFTSYGYPRFGKIIDIINKAEVTYPEKDYNHKQVFSKPSKVKHSLDNGFIHTEDDVVKALESGLFKYGQHNTNIEILSGWFEKYKDSERVKNLIVNVLTSTDKTLYTFFRSYINTGSGARSLKTDVDINQSVVNLFNYIYKKSMGEYFKPSRETRMLYDRMCFSRSSADNHDFLLNIYDDVDGNSNQQRDDKNLVGVYDITVGDSGMWSDEHILRYVGAISKILYGSTEPIGSPYVTAEKNMRPVPIGLIDAVNTVSDYEFVGKRSDGLKGKLHIDVYPIITQYDIRSNPAGTIHKFKTSGGNDFTVQLYYIDLEGVVMEGTKTEFALLEAMQKLPKKIKTKLQMKYPYLFGQLDSVILKESLGEDKQPDIDTYKMVVSNSPVDIIRCSACQGWDDASCMSIFGGSHNMSMEEYINNGSYIAYLTNYSEYEPQWLARVFMHQCANCNCVSIQDRLRHYDITQASDKRYPHWNLLYDAVKTLLADKGINAIDRSRGCTFKFRQSARDDINENGDTRCDDEMSEQRDECENNCRDECETEDKIEGFSEDISGDVHEEIDSRISQEISNDPTLEDDEDRMDEVTDRIKEEVTEGYEDDLLCEKIEECKDGCEDECRYVNDDFDCWEWLVNNGEVDEDDYEVWTDDNTIQPLNKGNQSYKDILLERTAQSADSLAFVRPAVQST